MTTIRIKQGKRGTTIRMKAGKGEDLRDVVARLAGQRAEPYKSNAQWPTNFYRMDGGITSDTHRTYDGAAHVCRALLAEGFGCQGIYFPLRVWVTGPNGEVMAV